MSTSSLPKTRIDQRPRSYGYYRKAQMKDQRRTSSVGPLAYSCFFLPLFTFEDLYFITLCNFSLLNFYSTQATYNINVLDKESVYGSLKGRG